ncbi:hypothetical protein D3C80_2106470 [compost metagenome]
MQQAAVLERDGCFDVAARYWWEGVALSVLDSERDWCEARALVCQKRSAQGSDRFSWACRPGLRAPGR